jgi:hypothetical protein
MDYIEELAKAKKALADKLAEEQRKQAKAGQEEQEAFQFLDRLRHFLVDNGSPGREEIEIEGTRRILHYPKYDWAGGSPRCT